MRTIVLSDAHISAGPLDNCDPELADHIATFFQTQALLEPPVELVINGDFLDFVQALPYEDSALRACSPDGVTLCFTESQSREKLRNIAESHTNVFSALGEFIRGHPRNTLVVLPGNHDPDFFWPGIRADFRKLLRLQSNGQIDRVRFHLNGSY